ncbi:MAG: dephospho-CoA kinase [Phycisphaerales bacterium]|jgi:dephospho-CoA kinase|nr:dephospho-CoA kinase [Phycisphaerales bacterium]
MTNRPPIIGITGGIGSGKSVVANILRENGCVVADADANTKEILDRKEVQQQLIEWWGEKVMGQDGDIDRSLIASIVFSEENERNKLESLIHPLVRSLQEKAFENAPKDSIALVIDAPLLMESGLDKECDVVIFVDSSFETRLKRVVSTRAWDEEQLRLREDVQIGLDKKRSSADYIVINDGDIAYIEQQTRSVLSLIRNSIRSSE